MSYRVTILLLGIVFTGACTVSKDPRKKEVIMLQKGKITEDTSYVYALPYEENKKYLIVQGYFGPFSHKNRAAIDFKMKKGSKIMAARDGVVIRARGDNTRGGWNKKNRSYANYIVVQHEDGTRAGYWHLQKDGVFVQVGDSVKRGQLIGLSGKTGYAAFPHLHFMVWGNRSGQGQIGTRFNTNKGIKYLRPFRKYGKAKSKVNNELLAP